MAKKIARAPEPRTAGRPEWEPSEEQRKTVESMSAVGVPQDDIARVVGCDPKTLRKHCKDELELGAIKANAKVSESLFKKATGDGTSAVAAGIWWEKTRQGRRDTSTVRHTGPGGGPMQMIDLTNATEAQLAALEAVFGAAALGVGNAEGDSGGESPAGS
jgi:hypothetical protein